MSFRIAGTGSYLPTRRLTNADLERMVETSDEWIQGRTGIQERHILEGEKLADIAEAAARRALEAAQVPVSGLCLVLVATLGCETVVPGMASTLHRRLGAPATTAAFDLNAACSGFLYALAAADGWMRRENRPVLVVGADGLSAFTDWSDRSTCVLFGDGAGACVLVPSDAPVYLHCSAEADTEDVLSLTGYPPLIHMNGQEVYKFATRAFVERVCGICQEAGIRPEDIAHFVPHQANRRIIQAASERLGLPLERFTVNIAHVGNTSAASVPIALDELCRSDRLRAGDWLALLAFGGGLTSAAALLRWQ